LVSNQNLMARVWPNVFVEPTNLTVHMSALRRALRDGQDGNRFIVNIPGRGYCFVASCALNRTTSLAGRERQNFQVGLPNGFRVPGSRGGRIRSPIRMAIFCANRNPVRSARRRRAICGSGIGRETAFVQTVNGSTNPCMRENPLRWRSATHSWHTADSSALPQLL
jgi:hypothetical protein